MYLANPERGHAVDCAPYCPLRSRTVIFFVTVQPPPPSLPQNGGEISSPPVLGGVRGGRGVNAYFFARVCDFKKTLLAYSSPIPNSQIPIPQKLCYTTARSARRLLFSFSPPRFNAPRWNGHNAEHCDQQQLEPGENTSFWLFQNDAPKSAGVFVAAEWLVLLLGWVNC